MSIQAMTWALSIPVPPSPKLTLVAIGNYADENGHCFPSIKRLASDSSQSYDTVSRRLRELETLGLLVRIPRHISPEGILNFEGKGRRTSDEIRLRLMVTPEDVRAGSAAAENEPQEADESGESADTPTPQLAGGNLPGLPPHSCAGTPPALLREHNEPSLEPKEDSPLTPQAGGDGKQSGNVPAGEAKNPWPHEASWHRLEAAWGDPILHQGICRGIWETFTDIERERFLRVIRGYLAYRLKQPKLPNRCNIQKLMREIDAWPGYEKLAGPDPALRTFVVEHSIEHHALLAIAQVGRWNSAGNVVFDVEQGQRGFWRGRALKPDELAMAQFFDKPIQQWTPLEKGTKPFYAWSDRIFDWTGVRRDELRVPCLFPPRKDGTFPSSIKEDTTDPPADETAA